MLFPDQNYLPVSGPAKGKERRAKGLGFWRPLLSALCVLLCLAGCNRPQQPVYHPPAPSRTPTATGAAEAKPDPEFSAVTASIKPYTVSSSFSEVSNYAEFKKLVPLTPEQEKLLAQNLFVCSPTKAEQLFYVYENNDYLNIPSFISVDTVLQVYHIFYDFTLRTVETGSLAAVLRRLTDGMLKDALATWNEASQPELKQAALKNVAYFGVAAKALGSSVSIPSEAAGMVRKETALIDAHGGLSVGAIFPYKIDYSQFAPRGHYTRSDALKRYFRAMMWYGLTPFALKYGGPRGPIDADEQMRQGLLLVRSLDRTGLGEDWYTIYEPTTFYVGAADDLTPAEFKKVSDSVFGTRPTVSALADSSKFDQFCTDLENAAVARIDYRIELQPQMPDPEVQLRFMGQRYLPDSEILQRLVKPSTAETKGRPFPSGLDVMAVLGSRRAAEILDTNAQLYNPDGWADYSPGRKKLVQEFAAVPGDRWSSNLYWSWLHSLRALLEPLPQGFPSFMLNDAWKDKSLNTALASWAELRHDTILYGKQSGVECGDGEERPQPKGYVEPNVVFYNRLLKLTQQSREGLSRRKLVSDRLKDRFEQFEDLLTFLVRVSQKELSNETLTEQEYEEIRYFGGKLESLTLSVMAGDPSHWNEITSETDRNMAVVADVHTEALTGKVLEEGVGPAYEILVIVPVDGKLQLTRGAAFSYYEFQHPISDRLTDEAWQAMLKKDRAPQPPPWTRSFMAPRKARPVKPGELEFYSTGC